MRLLPGVRIVDLPAPLDDGLPVMDVPVFVGFAERGPLDRPVALEDPAHYTAVFGGALELVPAETGDGGTVAPARMLRAHLPAAVAAFFAGGGRRCYVIRVADRQQASAASFPLAGLYLARRADRSSRWQIASEVFALRAASPGAWADRYEIAARLRSEPLHGSDLLAAGDLLRARSPAQPQTIGWLRAERAASLAATLDAAAARDWLWTPATGNGSALPVVARAPAQPGAGDDWQVERLRLDLAVRHAQHGELRRENCGLATGADNLPWFEADAGGRYDAGEQLPAAAWPLAGAPAALAASGDWLLLPATVDAFFAPWNPALLDGRDALRRNGLADYRPHLFTDPWWSGQLPVGDDAADLAAALQRLPRGSELRRWADDIRFLSPAPRRLLGLHGALGRDDAVSRDATWIAVPDAVHAGWYHEPPAPARSAYLLATPDPEPVSARQAFAACRPPPPPIPQAPRLDLDALRATHGGLAIAPADTAWVVDALPGTADASPPAGLPRVSFELQIAQRADFLDARALVADTGEGDDTGQWPSPDGLATCAQAAVVAGPRYYAPARYVLRLPAGSHFLRARAWRAGRYSEWSAPAEVLARAAGWRSRGVAPEDGRSPLLAVHCALLDLCAATREHFALLSLPEQWTAEQLARHGAALRRHAASAFAAEHAESFVALHHPWLLRREAKSEERDGTAASELHAHPAEGAILALYARRSRQRGAWAAAGLDPLPDVVGLSGETTDAAAIEMAAANPLEVRPTGIAVTAARTLAADADWRGLGVRRLFILLRRLARREGERYSFEANDLTLRRSLEHRFHGLLQRLLQRGAFRGRDAAEAYALRTASGRAFEQEVERGECTLEIRVAPSQPLRFLTLRVLRSGDQLLLEER